MSSVLHREQRAEACLTACMLWYMLMLLQPEHRMWTCREQLLLRHVGALPRLQELKVLAIERFAL